LIVDDEKDLVSTYSEYLSLHGIKTSTAYDGCEAFTVYEKTIPDLVLMDINMPKYDGNYAIKKIKEKYEHAKILVITGNIDYKFEKNMVNKILYKPLKLKELREIIINECKN
jgi:DNA-binding response OmpR family regulator